MKQSSLSNAIAKFFKTTTLHGFKYLVSQYYYDRIGWALCCLASACCAGVLCVVLWQRFLKVPALLQLRDLGSADDFQQIPNVVVCQPPDVVVENFLSRITTNGVNTSRLPTTLTNALQGKPTDESQVDLLEGLLTNNDMTLQQVLYEYSPDCVDLIKRCRWRHTPVDCERLFKKELTRWGVCCVATPSRFANISIPALLELDVIRQLDMALQCANGSVARGCEFFTKYPGEEWVSPTRLTPGRNYWAYLTFTSEQDSDADKLVDGTCVSASGYSRSHCLLKCTAHKCGCSDPLRSIGSEENSLPTCDLKRISCLRTLGLRGNSTCSCLPSCKKVITRLDLESSPLRELESCVDPLYTGLNATEVVVFRLRVNIVVSKVFSLMPTETWLTLLSSLGGVFNMFLGVGLFSALEFLFLLFVKLPIAVRRSTEMDAPTSVFNRGD
ncbi:sodium channel protein Nach-like [Ostrinia furnacalis]|uniref:sodium channel protein Nach-like n=1 Tax=Ostrinia furnacalis TaxID=93504 RepID=UPI00103BE44C|nr:sodium channel protein Nach-like [Ostrinia furnacalis]